MIGPDPRPLREAGLSTVSLPYGAKFPPPLGWDRWCHAPPTDAELRAMFDDGQRHNIAIPLGPASGGTDITGEPYTAGLVVAVFNNRRFFEAWAHGADLVTWTWVAESYRGPHVYIRLRDELPARTLYWNAGPSFPSVLELRTTGSYVVGAGSLHPSGVFYAWCEPRPREIINLEVDEFRAWFRERRLRAAENGWHLRVGNGAAGPGTPTERANPNVPRVLPDEIRGPGDEAAGERHFVLVSLAGTLRRRGLEAAEIAACLYEVNARRCIPPCPDADMQRIAASIARYAPDEVPETSAPAPRLEVVDDD